MYVPLPFLGQSVYHTLYLFWSFTLPFAINVLNFTKSTPAMMVLFFSCIPLSSVITKTLLFPDGAYAGGVGGGAAGAAAQAEAGLSPRRTYWELFLPA